jgi:hypothetical protein
VLELSKLLQRCAKADRVVGHSETSKEKRRLALRMKGIEIDSLLGVLKFQMVHLQLMM